MFSTVAKAPTSALTTANKSTFFRKVGDETFFKPAMLTPPVQAKLNVHEPNDRFEKEADHVADSVVQTLSETTVPAVPVTPITPVNPAIQNKCATCEEEEKNQEEAPPAEVQLKCATCQEEEESDAEVNIQRKCATCDEEEKSHGEVEVQRKCAACAHEEKEHNLQRKEDGQGYSSASNLEADLQSSQNSGSPLPPQTQNQMEAAMGHDLGAVRIHTSSKAVQMSQALNAQAFTNGNNIFFNQGKFDTTSTAGKHLLAHEITHTIQQSGKVGLKKSNTPVIQRVPGEPAQTAPPRESSQRNSEACRGTSVNGPGLTNELNPRMVNRVQYARFLPAARVWELSNFDIGRSFVKPEHRRNLATQIIPQIRAEIAARSQASFSINIVGEASTTASQFFNLNLSEDRGNCVQHVFTEAGFSRSTLIVPYGEDYAYQRREWRHLPQLDEVEDFAERKVTIFLNITSPPPPPPDCEGPHCHEDDDDTEDPEVECGPTRRQRLARTFQAVMINASGDILQGLERIGGRFGNVLGIINWILGEFGVSLRGGGAFLVIGTKDGNEPLIRLFSLGGISTAAGGSIAEWNVLNSPQFTLNEPKRLETTDGASDFDGPVTLEVVAGTNNQNLLINGNGINTTVSFRGVMCSPDGHSFSGRMISLSTARCRDLFTGFQMWQRRCTDDCPDSRKTAGGHNFTIKTGRVTYSSIPVIGRSIANRIGGCGGTFAFVNIGTEVEPGEWIHRDFLFIGINTNCAFEVEAGTVNANYTLPRFLSIPIEDAQQLSNFAGPASIDATGNMSIMLNGSTTFHMPGRYNAGAFACVNGSVSGTMIPISDVECSEVPAPSHSTARDYTYNDRCNEFMTDARRIEMVAAHTSSYFGGEFTADQMYANLPSPGIFIPRTFLQLSNDLRDNPVQNNVIAFSRTRDGVPSMSVVSYRLLRSATIDGRVIFYVRILSEPCTYRADFSPVFLVEQNCQEAYMRAGDETVIYPYIPRRRERGVRPQQPQP